MTPFVSHKGVAAPLHRPNIDTDAIIPSREMRRVTRKGLGDGLFAGWRYRYRDGQRVGPAPDFVLNDPAFRGASILVAGENFGCGSSREYAVWALADFGVRAILAPSFGAIFHGNCLRNGLLPVQLSANVIATLASQLESGEHGRIVDIDLRAKRVTGPDGRIYSFDIDSKHRERLLSGSDDIAETLRTSADLDAFRRRYRDACPWAFLD